MLSCISELPRVVVSRTAWPPACWLELPRVVVSTGVGVCPTMTEPRVSWIFSWIFLFTSVIADHRLFWI